jgi:hypothetical protein
MAMGAKTGADPITGMILRDAATVHQAGGAVVAGFGGDAHCVSREEIQGT